MIRGGGLVWATSLILWLYSDTGQSTPSSGGTFVPGNNCAFKVEDCSTFKGKELRANGVKEPGSSQRNEPEAKEPLDSTRLRPQGGRAATDDSLEMLYSSFLSSGDCDFIVASDGSFRKEEIFEKLVSSSSVKQVVSIESSRDLEEGVIWKSPRCQRILLLLSDPGPLIEFGGKEPFLWDYAARVLILGLSEESLRKFVRTEKAKKTEHIVGVVKGEGGASFKVFMNELWPGNQLTQVSHWRRSSSMEAGRLFPDKVSNFHRLPLHVVVFEWQPAILYHRDKNGRVLLRYGRDPAIVEALSEVFNFTIAYKEPLPDELWGARLPNGSYNGMVGLLASGQGDLAIANLFITGLDGRRKYQEFSTPFADDQGCYLARVDPPLPRWLSPVLPFQATAWIAVLLGILLAGPILYGFVFASKKIGDRESLSMSFSASVIFTYAVHFGQPAEISSSRSSIRIFTTVFLFYTLIISTGYKSNLTAFFTVTRQSASIETFRDLYESGLKVLGISYDKVLLQSSENQYLRELVNRFEVKPHFNEMKADVLSGKAVATGSKRFLEMAEAQITTAKGKPLVRIMKLQKEGGKDNNHYKTSDRDAEEEGATPLSMEHLQGVFLLLVFGYLIAAIFLVMELAVYHRKRSS